MALTDINFQEGDNQHFVVEIPLGALNAPVDMLLEPLGSQYPVGEIPQPGRIFVISE